MDDDLLRFLQEDVGVGDITTKALVGPAQRAIGVLLIKRDGVVCGLAEASAVFAHFGVKVEHLAKDGDRLRAPAQVLRVKGPAAAILTAERLALNLLMRMSGIATLTRELQDRVSAKNPACRVAATRKTTPGFRRFEKRAVEVGGGDPHRFGLHDAFLVKDNHLALVSDTAGAHAEDADASALASSMQEVVRRCRALDPKKLLQIEADRPEQAFAAAQAGADAVLLDNFPPAQACATYTELKAKFPKLMVEVSGGITPANVVDYADAADRISLGFLTHSAQALDFGLDLSFDVRPEPDL